MSDPLPPPQKPKRVRRGCGIIFFLFMLAIAGVWGAALGAFLWILDDAKNTIEALEQFRPKIGSKIYSFDGELLGEFTIEDRQIVPLSEMPLHLQKAFIATEDHPFYEHFGVRPDAILRSAMDGFQSGHFRGGSTITQQVVRNIEDLGVGLERQMQRKIREAIVALQVEQEFTKDEILELYLNQIFLGISAFGVDSAARQYFGISCRDVTLGMSATLAGLTRAPNPNNPINNLENAVTRRDIVLGQMLNNGFISEAQHEAALAEDLAGQVITPEERARLREEGTPAWRPNRFAAAYFSEEVRKMILDRYGKEEVFEGGLEVYTSLDMRLQQAAERALLGALDEFDAKKLESLRKAGKEDEFVEVSGGLVCLDNRPEYRGFVRALVGGRDFDTQKFNTATQALRQPGSSIKPFVWAAAIAEGFTPSTIVVDAPYTRVGSNGKQWSPKNFDGKYQGAIPIRYALEKSVNIISVKLVEKVGMPIVRSYLQRCGIRTPIDDSVGLTIALGTPLVTMLDHCTAYSCFANGGMRYDPVFITEVYNRDGIKSYDYVDYAKHERAMDENVAYVVTHMMEAVAAYGTGARTSPLERPRAGKTGTTNESRNVWFCGFTPDFTCIVWVGYRDNRSLGRGADFTGGRLAAPIWTDFMLAAEEGMPVREFEPPPGNGVTFFNIDRRTGVLGGNYREAYITGTSPPKAYVPPPVEETESVDLAPIAMEPIADSPA